MTEQHPRTPASRLRAALESTASSTRLQAALTAGTSPQPDYVDVLVERSAVEPDFFVRDMLTWALTRHDPVSAVDRLLPELRSPVAQARSQALHTLSKIGVNVIPRLVVFQRPPNADATYHTLGFLGSISTS